MAKKKKKETPEFQEVVGTPTALLLPARMYRFKVYTQEHAVEVPKSGTYVDLDKKSFTKEDGNFNLLQTTDEGEQIVYFPAISKVLFGTNQYPELKDGEAFAPVALIIKDDKVTIVGNMIEMVKEN